MFLNLERQNQLQVYRIVNGESVEPKALFTKDTLDNQAASKPAQMTGAIHVHPNGRFVYISNRASGTTVADGKPVWEGGENTIGVYAIDQKTGEPVAHSEHRQRRHARADVYARRGIGAARRCQSECGNQTGWHARARVAGRVPCRGRRQARRSCGNTMWRRGREVG